MRRFASSKMYSRKPAKLSQTVCFNLMRNRCQPGLGDLHVMLRRVKARPDGADHLAIDDNWKRALHLSEAARGNRSNATVVDRIFKRLTRLLE
jgi:hypothetical protein